MRSIAICGDGVRQLQPHNRSISSIRIDGVPVWCGEMRTEPPAFDAADPALAHSVLVRVRAFSCNFRDKALVLRMAGSGASGSFYTVGSEFAGQVVAVGEQVTELAPGDRVVGDNAWPHVRGRGWKGGIPTNHASREYLVLRQEKLALAPDSLGDGDAAAFSLGAQTAYSMVDKLQVQPGDRVLVTAARSNTSLFAIGLLRRRGAEVYVTTSSHRFDEALAGMGVRGIFRVEAGAAPFTDHPAILAAARETGGFQAALDPFFDLHLDRVLPVLAFGGRYVTCGFQDQSPGTGTPARPAPEYGAALQVAMLKNLHVIGNCLGTREHLRQALDDHAAGGVHVHVDSVFGGGEAAGFLRRTYAAPDRMGKVVYAYE